MKLLFDMFPVILFFIAYKMFNIIVATVVLMVAMVGQIAWLWFRHKRVEKIHIVSLVLVILLGSATVILDDPLFIQWKVSVVHWIFALAFLGSQFIGKQNLTHRMFSKAITLKVDIWGRLNMASVVFFTAMGFLNLYVMYNFDEATWVNFKLFGVIGLTFVFYILLVFYMTPYIEQDEKSEEK